MMYTSGYCAKSAFLVLLFSGRDSSDDDYQRMLDGWSRLYHDAEGRIPIGVVVVEAGHAPPNAGWRRRIAAVQREHKGPRRIAVVTSNPLIRAVITAVEWMTPPGPNQHTSAFATFEDAARALEAQEGRRLDRIRALHHEAQQAARQVA
jgi:hypothetical protein